jgi:hypothetical protein
MQPQTPTVVRTTPRLEGGHEVLRLEALTQAFPLHVRGQYVKAKLKRALIRKDCAAPVAKAPTMVFLGPFHFNRARL